MADIKKQKQFAPIADSAETLKENLVAGAKDVLEVPQGLASSALEQLGLKERKAKVPLHGEIDIATGINKTNQNIEAKTASVEAKLRQLQAVQRQETEVFNKQKKDLEQKIAAVMRELQAEVTKLQMQTAELSGETKKITVETIPANAGSYHLNFFDWVIGTLRDIRKKVNESRMWLNLWNRKKKQKGYWAMFKKKGTEFVNEERAIATANG